jgi:hypothetical protein
MGPGVLFQFFPFFATPRRKNNIIMELSVWPVTKAKFSQMQLAILDKMMILSVLLLSDPARLFANLLGTCNLSGADYVWDRHQIP